MQATQPNGRIIYACTGLQEHESIQHPFGLARAADLNV